MASSTQLSDPALSRATDPEPGDRHLESQGEGLLLLQELVLGKEQRQLAQLVKQVEKLESDTSAAGVSRVLPMAFELRGQHDQSLVPALLPAVERAIEESARANPRVLTDAIFPILGPIVRKSIASGL